jgi:hypothetical protein
MRLSAKGLAAALGILWGGAVLFVGIINLGAQNYGVDFLRLMASVYPGFNASGTVADVLVGTLYGLVDGAIAGALTAWLYNVFAGRVATARREPEITSRAA